MTVGLVNTHYAYLPIPLVIAAPRTVDAKGKQWNRLRAAIGQPALTGTANTGTVGELEDTAVMTRRTLDVAA